MIKNISEILFLLEIYCSNVNVYSQCAMYYLPEGNKKKCCTQPGDYYFLKLHVSTKLRSYKN